MTDPAVPHVAAELEPRFLVTVTLDGDDYPATELGDVGAALAAALAQMQDDGVIRAYTIERAP